MTFMHRLRRLAVLASLASLVSLPALAQSNQELQDRIRRLENDVQALMRMNLEGGGAGPISSGAGSAVPPAAISDMQVRIAQQENQIRFLTGRIEKLSFENKQLAARLTKLQDDAEYRFGQLERSTPQTYQGGQAIPPAGATIPGGGEPLPQTAVPQESRGLPEGPAEKQYDFAIGLLRDGNYQGAQTAFEQFVALHPRHRLAGNAQYWLGETFYARSMFREASLAFVKGMQKYKSGPKGPDTMLKLGMSTHRLGNLKAACKTFSSLPQRYPNASPKIKSTAKRELGQIDCADYLR